MKVKKNKGLSLTYLGKLRYLLYGIIPLGILYDIYRTGNILIGMMLFIPSALLCWGVFLIRPIYTSSKKIADKMEMRSKVDMYKDNSEELKRYFAKLRHEDELKKKETEKDIEKHIKGDLDKLEADIDIRKSKKRK